MKMDPSGGYEPKMDLNEALFLGLASTSRLNTLPFPGVGVSQRPRREWKDTKE
jgi:hypothetical protein